MHIISLHIGLVLCWRRVWSNCPAL